MKNIVQKLIVIFLVVIILSSTNIALAVTQQDLDNQQNAINNQKDQQNANSQKQKEIEEQKNKVEKEKSQTMKEVESLATQIDSYESQIGQLEAQIEDANNKIQEAENKLKQAEEDYLEQQDTLEQRVVAMYEAGEVSYLDVLLSSENLTDLISNYYLLSEITQYDQELLVEIQKRKEEIEQAKKDIENNKNELTTAKASKESVTGQLKTAKEQKDIKVANLSATEKELQKEIEELQIANRKIANDVALAEKKYNQQLEELKKQQEQEKNNNNNNENSSGNAGTSGSGYFMQPIKGGSTITADGYYPSGKFHGAIDYAVNSGTPVYAAADGVVYSTANLSSSYGTYVVIRHTNGLQSYYAHGTYGSISVTPGQIVKKGQKIMLSGNTGNSSGPHLHFEVRKAPYNYNYSATAYGQDSRVNPSNYF